MENAPVQLPSPTQATPPEPLTNQAPAKAISFNTNSTSIDNNTWTKTIPIINYISLAIIISFGLLDLWIAISSPELRSFGIPMLIAGGFFLVYFYNENIIYKTRFSLSDDHFDTAILVMVIIRNIIFILNVIPLIQLLGWLLVVPVGIPVLVVHAILINKKKASNQGNLAT